jgi:quercetin dioxygenase-like cupin family protein
MTLRPLPLATALLAAACLSGAEEQQPTAASSEPAFLNASELKWGAAPPDLPKGGQIVVLHGDPGKPGPFTLRFKMPDGYKIAPHWHTQDEQLTILSGTLLLHMGDSLDSPAHELQVGSYHFLPGKMHHAAESRGETIVQLHGTGPFDIHYLNPADNPNPATAAK